MLERFLKLFPWFLGLLVIVNLVFLDFMFVSRGSQKTGEPSNLQTAMPTLANKSSQDETCSTTCQTFIAEEVAKVIADLPTPAEKVTNQTPVPKTTPVSQSKASYLPLAGSGSTASLLWADIAGTDFYFNLADFPQSKSVHFEVSLQSYVSTDLAYIRLYDVTNKRGVDNSELSTHSSAYEYLTSGALSIWQGNNLYRIQGRGASGNQVNFSSAKLKIIY